LHLENCKATYSIILNEWISPRIWRGIGFHAKAQRKLANRSRVFAPLQGAFPARGGAKPPQLSFSNPFYIHIGKYLDHHKSSQMKKLTLLLIAAASMNSLHAQQLDESKVPAAVKKSFSAKYPGVAHPSWEKENGQYEASYKKDDQSMSATFKSDGTFTESELDIRISELPAAATKYMNEHYKGIEIKEASKITKANGSINYEAAIKGKDVIFDTNGQFIKEAKD